MGPKSQVSLREEGRGRFNRDKGERMPSLKEKEIEIIAAARRGAVQIGPAHISLAKSQTNGLFFLVFCVYGLCVCVCVWLSCVLRQKRKRN